MSDKNRELARAERDRAREEAAMAEVQTALAKAREVDAEMDAVIESQSYESQLRCRGGSIIVQLSDLHIGAMVKGLEARADANEYRMKIAAHRLAMFAQQTIFYGAAHGANHCTVALTGDIFDSRVGKARMDKIFNSETSATQSFMQGKSLIIQFIETIRRSEVFGCLLYTSPSPRDATLSRMPSSA